MNPTPHSEEKKGTTSVPGNALNPPANAASEVDGNQVLGKEAEKYLREGGNIEDLPDEEDWEETEEVKQHEKGE